jgi:hypothetical protein
MMPNIPIKAVMFEAHPNDSFLPSLDFPTQACLDYWHTPGVIPPGQQGRLAILHRRVA